jgi:hypothetical protein
MQASSGVPPLLLQALPTATEGVVIISGYP